MERLRRTMTAREIAATAMLFIAAGCDAPATDDGPGNTARGEDSTESDWVFMDDHTFAETHAAMAFEGSLEDRQRLAWMFFARLNQQIDGGTRIDPKTGELTGTAPVWMAWPTDPETFPQEPGSVPSFDFSLVEVDEDLDPSIAKKVLAGRISDTSGEGVPDSSEEEVTRNQLGFDYIKDNGLYTTPGVQAYINAGNQVDLPVGAIETKAKWLPLESLSDAPEGAFVFAFVNSKTGDPSFYYWGGLHIMAKMRPTPVDAFYDASPSWFWATFEYKGNPGLAHVVTTFINEKAPLEASEIESILTTAGIGSFGYQAYAPNGTQIDFSTDGGAAVILGHTQMEDFAGHPDSDDPEGWTSFDSSCHTCHATSAIQPETVVYFPFSVPIGELTPEYSVKVKDGPTYALSEGFVPLDFMWPIVFNARKGD